MLLGEGSSEVFLILCTLLTLRLKPYGGLRIKTFAGVGQNYFLPCKVHFDCILFYINTVSVRNNHFLHEARLYLTWLTFLKLMVFALGSGNSTKLYHLFAMLWKRLTFWRYFDFCYSSVAMD